LTSPEEGDAQVTTAGFPLHHETTVMLSASIDAALARPRAKAGARSKLMEGDRVAKTSTKTQ
jgi:hypothetical protein